MQNRTTILISHRVSAIRNAKQILFLEDGEIIENGNHNELMMRKGAYYELYQKQLIEEKIINQ